MPADECVLSLADRIVMRPAALELAEVLLALSQSSEHSLVLCDGSSRDTTCQYIERAYKVIDALRREVRARTLFVTHSRVLLAMLVSYSSQQLLATTAAAAAVATDDAIAEQRIAPVGVVELENPTTVAAPNTLSLPQVRGDPLQAAQYTVGSCL